MTRIVEVSRDEVVHVKPSSTTTTGTSTTPMSFFEPKTTTSRLMGILTSSTSSGPLYQTEYDVVLGTMQLVFESLSPFVVNSTTQRAFSNGIAAAVPQVLASNVTILQMSKGRRLVELIKQAIVEYEIVVAASPGGAHAEEVASTIFGSPDELKSQINSAFKDASLSFIIDSVTSPRRPRVKVLQSTLQTTTTVTVDPGILAAESKVITGNKALGGVRAALISLVAIAISASIVAALLGSAQTRNLCPMPAPAARAVSRQRGISQRGLSYNPIEFDRCNQEDVDEERAGTWHRQQVDMSSVE